MLQRFVAKTNHAVTEIGCGSGGNFLMLRQFGKIVGIEMHARARAYAVNRQNATVYDGALPYHMPKLPPQDVITAFDVLEHIKDDVQSLQTIYKMLSPQEILMLTVPAYPWLWSAHDERHHHVRRYTRRDLHNKICYTMYLQARVIF